MLPLLTNQLKRCLPGGEIPETWRAELEKIAQSADSTLIGDPVRALDEVTRHVASLESHNASLLGELAAQKIAAQDQAHAEAKYRTMFEFATVGIFQTSPTGQYLACNPALARIYGYNSAEELKCGVTHIQRQLYVEETSRPKFVALMSQHGHVEDFQARVYKKNGDIIWITETARAVRDAAGNLLHYEDFVADITAHKQAEDALRESQERYELAIRGANDGLWDWDLRSGNIYFSARWKEMLGDDAHRIGTMPHEWFDRVYPADLASVHAAIQAHREGITPHFEIEHRMMHSDGRHLWMLTRGIAIRDAAGNATRMVGSQTDITVRKEAEEQLVRDALHDSLTGLPNRVLFTDRLERSLARGSRDPQRQFAVLFLDMDRFKGVNDSLGHLAGDRLLVAFAQRIAACPPPSDTLARLGGDEFTILLDDPREPDDARGVASRILAALKEPFHLEAHEIFVTVSIGIALSSAGYTAPQDDLRDADTAMYRAKAGGKSRFEVFDAAMHARAVKLLQIENDLRRALERNEFELFYQPITLIDTGKIRAFEALIRWRHAERGLISPVDFIPVAEETGMILPIGRWVLQEVCRQTAAWHAMAPGSKLDINVNLSGKQFSQPDLVEQVTQTLRDTGLPACNVILEITESVIMENPEAAATTLRRLKALGVRLNIDDFGTGYSSLAYLQRFPVDTMKIDRSFVARMVESPENAEIVRTIVELAHNLNMKVTAEGIESAEQLAQLTTLNCENAQGYFLSRPLDQNTATDMVRQLQV